MRLGVALARPGFGGAQQVALSVAEALPGSVLLSPGDFEWLRTGTLRGLPGEVIAAPSELLQYGGATARLAKREQLRIYLQRALPYARRVAERLRALDVSVLYAGEERAQVLLGLGAALAGIPSLWHLQGGIIVRSRPVQGLAAALATRLVCNSHAVSRDLQDHVPPWLLPPTDVVYNGIERLPVTRQLPERPLLCVVSRLVPGKGVHHAVEALARVHAAGFPEARLCIAGDLTDDPQYVEYVRARVSALDLDAAVQFLGRVEDVHVLFSRSMLALCPSVEDELLTLGGKPRRFGVKEGFCLAAAEAMRAGCPVIASASYGLKEVVHDGHSGLLVPPSDPQALASAITELLAQPERRKRLATCARARFEEMFTRQQMVAGLERSLAAAEAQPRPHLRWIARGGGALAQLSAALGGR